jgi:hypothetical protein
MRRLNEDEQRAVDAMRLVRMLGDWALPQYGQEVPQAFGDGR